MSTWYGNSKKFSVEVSGPEYWGLEWKDIEFKWNYNTTSDTFAIQREDIKDQYCLLTSKEVAEAYLYMLADWYSKYEGKEHLKKLLEEQLKND